MPSVRCSPAAAWRSGCWEARAYTRWPHRSWRLTNAHVQLGTCTPSLSASASVSSSMNLCHIVLIDEVTRADSPLHDLAIEGVEQYVQRQNGRARSEIQSLGNRRRRGTH